METKYSNPRMEAIIPDWPSGSHRTEAHFKIEQHPKRGERATRTTKHPITGKPSAPKLNAYAHKARIVDGDDGRTYVIEFHGSGISVKNGDMKYSHEYISMEDAKFTEVKALFD